MRNQQKWVKTVVWVTVGGMVLTSFAVVLSIFR
jgi:hypothetical protein